MRGTPHGKPRVCVVAEEMAGQLDEGTRKFAYSLAHGLHDHGEVRAISLGHSLSDNGIIALPPSKTFFHRGLREQIERFAPDVVCYVPSASITVFAFMRAWLLKGYAPKATMSVVLLQPRRHTLPGRKVLSMLKPDVVFTQSERLRLYVRELGCRAAILPPGVDLRRFRPVEAKAREALRARHGLPLDAFIALHAGQAKAGRNLDLLTQLGDGVQPVLAVGQSTGVEGDLLDRLRRNGVMVIDKFVDRIEELHQAADCYVFPVLSCDDAIEVPLSVLEAMACNLPVVSTRFGGLPDLFRDGPGLRFVSGGAQLIGHVRERGWMRPSETRARVEPYSWSNVGRSLLEQTLR